MEPTVQLRRKNMINILSQAEEFIIIGLTGRNGAGCTEASKIFNCTYKELELPVINPGTKGFSDNKERERRIFQRYSSTHWLKFDVIKSKSIISTFLLKNFDLFIEEVNKNIEKKEKKITKENLYKEWISNSNYKLSSIFTLCGENFSPNLTKIFEDIDISDVDKEVYKKIGENLSGKKNDTKILLEYCVEACNKLGKYYKNINKEDFSKKPAQYISNVDFLLTNLAKLAKEIFLSENDSNTIWGKLVEMNDSLEQIPLENKKEETFEEKTTRFYRFIFVNYLMPELGDLIYKRLIDANISYTKLFQKFGNSIRCYGEIRFETFDEESLLKNDHTIFSIPQKIVQFIKSLRHPFSEYCRPVRIVIDSIKSVFEAAYLRQRYSSFYLFAISADESIRKTRLLNEENKRLSMRDIHFTDWNEYSSEGYKIYAEQKNTKNDGKENNLLEAEFYNAIKDKSQTLLYDPVREFAYKNKLHQFYLQDVAASIENADVFISNNAEPREVKNMDLRWEIVRNVSLIMFPGLVPPTPIERCMQIAFAAKCNSGCLSRQVGAVVTDKDYNILSIGWNDVPCGDISCSSKNVIDLCKLEDKQAYTNYELTNSEFRDIINSINYQEHDIRRLLRGLPFRYCFKDLHNINKPSNPMRSRAMHAEEKAFSACGNDCNGGYLFTTSSPCEMCSKNAKNHKISKIFYIELYPGISESQYSSSGDPSNIAQHVLFTGAIGRAYTQMYTPILPQKDILDLLGIYDEVIK